MQPSQAGKPDLREVPLRRLPAPRAGRTIDKVSLMPAVRGREGTHAKGSCEPGQAGRCSHKQRPLVQWISLSRRPAAGTFIFESFTAEDAESAEERKSPDDVTPSLPSSISSALSASSAVKPQEHGQTTRLPWNQANPAYGEWRELHGAGAPLPAAAVRSS